MRKNGCKIMLELIGLVKPLLHIMMITISMGVVGFLCSIFITIFGGFGILDILGYEVPFSRNTIITALIIFAVLRGILRYAEQASGHYIAFKLLAILRDKVFAALRKLAPAKLEGKEKGNLISVITTDIELLEVFYAHTIAPIAIAIITSLILVVFIGNIHSLLGVVALVAYLIVGALIPFVNSKMGREVGREYRKKFGELNSYVLESLRGLRETLQYDIGKERMEKMKQQSEELDQLQGVLKRKEGMTKAATDAAILLCSVSMLFVSLALYLNHSITFDGVFIATIAMFSSFGPVVALSNLSNNLLQTFASGERVLAILQEEPLVKDVTNGARLVQEDTEGIRVDEVTFAYEKEVILQDVSLYAKKNEMLGICGKSGSGKSTLLKLLMRFWETEKGTIRYEQKEGEGLLIGEINTESLRSYIGYMTQETFLFQESIAENIKLGRASATMEEVMEAAKKASIHDFIMTLPNGYDTVVTELGSNLSGGERQRIGLARAFLHDAPLLLLDEPTSNLDSLNEGVILKALRKEAKEKTVVMVSHRASTMNIVDRVYQMQSGRVS